MHNKIWWTQKIEVNYLRMPPVATGLTVDAQQHERRC